MMRTRIPPGGSFSIPPGGQVTLEISPVGTYQDPQGGPPIEVSNEVLPDAMAVYFLGTAIVECTRTRSSATRSLPNAAIAGGRSPRSCSPPCWPSASAISHSISGAFIGDDGGRPQRVTPCGTATLQRRLVRRIGSGPAHARPPYAMK
jgi:hypothetical protein